MNFWRSDRPLHDLHDRARALLTEAFILLSRDETAVLVDTSPDLREQLLAQRVTRLDAVLMTHPHADQTNGIDDLRPLTYLMKKRVDMHLEVLDEATKNKLQPACQQEISENMEAAEGFCSKFANAARSSVQLLEQGPQRGLLRRGRLLNAGHSGARHQHDDAYHRRRSGLHQAMRIPAFLIGTWRSRLPVESRL